ncbi:MAG TPA: AAA family ATPase, partial [Thermoanaerobaculia bacterium]
GLRFLSLDDFLEQQLFAGWPSIVTYNRAEGLGFATSAARGHFQERLRGYDTVHGTSWADGLPRDAANCFALLDSYFRHCAALQPARPVVLLLPFAETIVPAAEVAYRTPEDRAVLVYLRKWSQDPVLLAKNVVVVLVTESLAELDAKLVRAHGTREVEIVRPDPAERLTYLEAVRSSDWYAAKSDLPAARLAELTAGMTRVQIGQLLDGTDANGDRLTRERVRRVKKEVIETEGLGLLEYLEPKFDLSMVAGMPAVKDRLRRASRAIARGNPAAVPMGYLVCGPVGSAKTFLVECFANEIGFPCVKLKNFRSMWVGATEANLERILKILASLTPVGVMVDEADAALGNREQQGDSGTQNRVFAQIAAFMGDTRNRGKILWFLITARPDLLPIDLKRQGRAEEHIPLFYPETAAEYDEIYKVMLKKLGLKTQVASISEVATEDQYLGLSGSDLEAVLVRATLEAEAAESSELKPEHLQKAFSDFIPPANTREREMQILCAILECTSRELLPERFRALDRGEVQGRINEIKRELRLI